MKLLLLSLFCGLALCANVERTKREISPTPAPDALKWKNCMKNSTIQLNNLTLTPLPIQIPGQVKVNMNARFKRSIPNLIAKVNIKRKTFFDFSIPIPCINNLGSCTYSDVCTLIQKQDEFVAQARLMFTAGGMEPKCPLPAKTINVENFMLTIPPLEYSMLTYAISGEYIVETKFIDQHTGEHVGCVEMEVAIGGKKETTTPTPAPDGPTTTCSGWFFC